MRHISFAAFPFRTSLPNHTYSRTTYWRHGLFSNVVGFFVVQYCKRLHYGYPTRLNLYAHVHLCKTGGYRAQPPPDVYLTN